MNKHIDPTKEFRQVGKRTKRSDEFLLIRANALKFIEKIKHLKTGEQINKPQEKEFLIKTVRDFLIACDFYSALRDFDELVEFKSRANERRSDGTYNIYHEIIPFVNVLTLVAAGKEKGGIDLNSLEQEGGLGVKLQTIINHDNIEDKPIKREWFQKDQIDHTEEIINKHKISRPYVYTLSRQEWERNNALLVSRNVWVVTKKTVDLDKDDKPIYLSNRKLSRTKRFETVEDFLREMVDGLEANVTSLTTKLYDLAHNTGTITGSKKHTTENVLAWCNSLENLYGTREALTDEAKGKWPEHANEIEYCDALLGSVLYLRFGRLTYVEDAYKNISGRYKIGDPHHKIRKSGIGYRYLKTILAFDVPRFASIFHEALDRERELAKTDPQVKIWLERNIYPALEDYKKHFPEIFDELETEPKISTSMGSTIKGAVHAPTFH